MSACSLHPLLAAIAAVCPLGIAVADTITFEDLAFGESVTDRDGWTATAVGGTWSRGSAIGAGIAGGMERDEIDGAEQVRIDFDRAARIGSIDIADLFQAGMKGDDVDELVTFSVTFEGAESPRTFTINAAGLATGFADGLGVEILPMKGVDGGRLTLSDAGGDLFGGLVTSISFFGGDGLAGVGSSMSDFTFVGLTFEEGGVAVPVPAPASAAVGCVGLALVAGRRRR